jgi:polyol transport system substrate-binding protein
MVASRGEKSGAGSRWPRRRLRARRATRLRLAVLAAAAALLASGCAGAGALGAGSNTIVIAIVSNPQMQDAVSLAPEFEKQNPGIKLKFVSLPENEARAKITASVATGGGEFDAVMISNYETPDWAKNGWLVNLQPYVDKTDDYDQRDFIPSIRKSLSYKSDQYSVPFYGESSFLAYRKDLFEKAGLKMPAHPTWRQVAGFAAKLNDPKHGVAGICLRGLPGWGENLAPFDTVVNTFGGRWFDTKWNAQLDSPEFHKALEFYNTLLNKYGEPGAASSGFSECVTAYSQGQAAMWYDATSMVSTVESKADSKVVGKSGYAPAPVQETAHSGWLYTWSLGIPKTSTHKDDAWKFLSWVTSKQYIRLVGDKLGWARVPPGSRLSTYQIPQYKKIAKSYARPTLDALRFADPKHPTKDPVPYTGIQFVGIPEFQDLGTRVSQQVSAAIAGQVSVEQALKESQQYAQDVGDTYKGGS